MSFHDEEAVEFGGQSLTLALDFRIIDLIEHSTGLTMPAAMAEFADGKPQTNVLARILWAMTRRHHPELKFALLGGLLLGDYRCHIIEGMCALLSRTMNFGEGGGGRSTVKWSLKDFLVEWVALGGPDDRFWAQTPKSYVAAIEGMARAASRQHDLAVTSGWHAAMFALAGYAGKLRGNLSDYLTQKVDAAIDDRELRNARGIHFFHALKARGFAVEIEKVTRH